MLTYFAYICLRASEVDGLTCSCLSTKPTVLRTPSSPSSPPKPSLSQTRARNLASHGVESKCANDLYRGFAPVNLVEWISSCKNVTETRVRFPENPHGLLQRVAARNVVSYKVAAVSGC